MKHIKLFESTNIDKEEIKLWMVDLLDQGFDIKINSPYHIFMSDWCDGVAIEFSNSEQYIIRDIIEILYFVTDMMKRRYNLNLSHISLLSKNHSYETIENVISFDKILDSTITSDHAIGIYYEPEPKGLNKYVQKFLDFNPVHKISNFPVNMVMKGAEKLNKYLKSKK
jgi:hypothetical protein